MSVVVLGEPGSTHEGNLSNMEQCVDVAVAAGCDSIKFQWVSDAHELARRRKAPEYVSAYKKIEFPLDYLDLLKRRWEDYGIHFGCTVYLPEDARLLAPYVSFFKVASFDANDLELVKAVAKHNKPTYISTGMRSERDIVTLRTRIRSCTHKFNPYYLHCISSYPAPLDQMNLCNLRHHWFIGLSDHSRNLLTGAIAVGAGAQVIETHFRIHNTPKHNADYDVSFTPAELTDYVSNIRLAETMCGKYAESRKVESCEMIMQKYLIN